MIPEPKVSVVILNWNGWEDTIECLESLRLINYTNYNVILVDNGSEDESIEKIKKYAEGNILLNSNLSDDSLTNIPIDILEYTKEESEQRKELDFRLSLFSDLKMILIFNDKNYGFAEGNNVGIRFAMRCFNPDYILLLNNDTVVDHDFLFHIVKVGEEHKEGGIIGPKIYYYNYKGSKDVINFAGGKLNMWMGRPLHIGANKKDNNFSETNCFENIKYVDWIQGSCFLIKKELIKDIGVLSAKYFFGFEEIDFCLRASKVNYKCVYVPYSKIWHKVGSSLGGSFGYFHLSQYIKNSLIFMLDNGRWYHQITFIPFFVISILSKVFVIYRKERKLSVLKKSFDIVFKNIFDALQ